MTRVQYAVNGLALLTITVGLGTDRIDHAAEAQDLLHRWGEYRYEEATVAQVHADIVRMHMPDLARALDRLAKGGQR